MVDFASVFFATTRVPACHAATLVEVRPGELFAAWFAGTHEGHADMAIWGSRFKDERWEPASKIADEAGVPLWNPVLFRDAKGTVWLFYKAGPDVPSWTGFCMRSVDCGATWSTPRMLPAGILGPAKNKPITLSNGNILSGTSVESWSNWVSWAEISEDYGLEWRRCGPILPPNFGTLSSDTLVSATWDVASGQLHLPQRLSGVIQPALWEHKPGHVRMLVRATQQVGAVCVADSSDFGHTWTKARPTSIPNSNSGLDAVRLADGRIALVCNPVHEGRTPLSLLLSNDNGETWPIRIDLETGPGEFSYPSIIQTIDGLLHVIYTFRREQIRHAIVNLNDLV